MKSIYNECLKRKAYTINIPSHVESKRYNHESVNHKACEIKLEVLKCLDHKHKNGMMPMCVGDEIA